MTGAVSDVGRGQGGQAGKQRCPVFAAAGQARDNQVASCDLRHSAGPRRCTAEHASHLFCIRQSARNSHRKRSAAGAQVCPDTRGQAWVACHRFLHEINNQFCLGAGNEHSRPHCRHREEVREEGRCWVQAGAGVGGSKAREVRWGHPPRQLYWFPYL